MAHEIAPLRQRFLGKLRLSVIDFEENLIIEELPSNQNVRMNKNRHQSLPTSEWNRIREPFTKLWLDDGLELKDVKKIMAERYNFHASTSMYKKQSADWGLSKIFTTEEKMELGRLAERLIAKNQKLPTHDSTGRLIPWDRVRRQYGRDKISPLYLPLPLQRKRVPDGRQAESYRTKATTDPSASDLNESQSQHSLSLQDRHSKFKGVQPLAYKYNACLSSLTGTASMIHISPEIQRTEKVLFYINEWYIWCQLNNIDRSVTVPVEIWGQCEKAWAYLKRNSSKAFTSLASLATSIYEALRQPTVFLPGCILGIWAALQDKDFGEHGLSIARYLVDVTKSVLGPFHPLYYICHALLEDVMANLSRNLRNRITLPMNVVASYIEDELDRPTEAQNTKKIGSSLLYALTWHDPDCFGWAASPTSKPLINECHELYQTLLDITSTYLREGSAKAAEIRHCLYGLP